MASSEWEKSGTIVFVITGGPSADEFLVHGLAHLRDIRSAPPFEFVYGHGGRTAMALTQLGQKRRGRYLFKALATDWTKGPVPLRAEIKGFYDPSTRKGYFHVLPERNDKEWQGEDAEEYDRWRRFVGSD
jgi:hypothetical protein